MQELCLFSADLAGEDAGADTMQSPAVGSCCCAVRASLSQHGVTKHVAKLVQKQASEGEGPPWVDEVTKGPRTAEEIFDIFNGLKECFRNFAPPAGLALDFTPSSTMSPDDAIKQLFTFIPPAQFIYEPLRPEAVEEPLRPGASEAPETSFAETGADDPSAADVPSAQGIDQNAGIQPLRLVKFASDPKQILANIIRRVYTHFRSPTCQQFAKRLDGFRRILLRKNSKAAAVEPLLLFALIQGNAASAGKFPTPSITPVNNADRNAIMQRIDEFKVPANTSSEPGIYDPNLIVTYFDLVKAGESGQLKKLENLLKKPADESAVGNKLFGNSLASPTIHANITTVGGAVGSDEELLQKLVERIGYMAMDTSDAVSTLLPNYPNVAAFVRGVSFFAFEGVFKQNGPYIMPGLPCGGNLSGNMLETITNKKLGTTYYVYKYTKPLANSQLPNDVWMPEGDSEVAQYFKATGDQEQGAYLFSHVPRVCARAALFQKCSKKPPQKVQSAEEQLCEFINTHQSFFFRVDGKGVYAMRKNMQKAMPRGRLMTRAAQAMASGLRSIRRNVFSKTTAALVLGTAAGALCIGIGLGGILAGAACAVGAGGLLRTLFAVAPFSTKPVLPLSLATFLSADFQRNLSITLKMLGSPDAQPQQGLVDGAEQEASSLPMS
ncbi:hypothetical protein Efla_007801 [Eimeria flavescens]